MAAVQDPITKIPDEILLYIMAYVSVSDRIALAESGLWPQITERKLLNQPSHFNLSRFFHSRPVNMDKFFTHFINGNTVTTFVFEDCDWVCKDSLARNLLALPHLEELYLENTQLSLLDLPEVLKQSKHLRKISVNLDVVLWHEYWKKQEANQQSVAQTFGDMQKLEGLSLAVDCRCKDKTCVLWPRLIEILAICSGCTRLILSICHCTRKRERIFLGRLCPVTRATMFSQLEWMNNLKTFVLVTQGSRYIGPFPFELCQWMVHQLALEKMEHFWMDTSMGCVRRFPPNVKSVRCGHSGPDRCPSTQLIHYYGNFYYMTDGMATVRLQPQLKFFGGHIENDSTPAFRKFCSQHPALETLELLFLGHDAPWVAMVKKWNAWIPMNSEHPILTNLRSLKWKYQSCAKDDFSELLHFIKKNAPNLEEVEIDWMKYGPNHFPHLAGFKKLTKLTLVTHRAKKIFHHLKEVFAECHLLRTLTIKFQGSSLLWIKDIVKMLPKSNVKDFSYGGLSDSELDNELDLLRGHCLVSRLPLRRTYREGFEVHLKKEFRQS